MMRYQKISNKFSPLAALALVINIMLPSFATAAAVTTPLDLATIPLANSPTITIQPNLLFVLDDSGSMEWNFMPDQFGYNSNTQDQKKCRKYYQEGSNSSVVTQCSGGNFNGMGEGGDPPIYSYRVNTVYYNPGVYYQPPVNPCNFSANLPSQTNWSNVRTNGLLINGSCTQTSGTKDLLTTYPERVYCNGAGVGSATLSTLNSGSIACKQNGIDQLTGVSGDYDYPQTTGDWYTISSGLSTHVYARDYNSKPHYYNVIPREHCTDKSLVNCILSLTPTATHSVPAYVRFCNTDAQASSALVQSGTSKCQAAFDRTSATKFEHARYGNFQRVNIVPSVTSYPKANERKDCAGASCSYTEEMTNFANWYAYYRTRMLMMKSSTGLAFKDVGEDFRVGFMTIKPNASESVKFDTFNTAHKSVWYKKLYEIAGESGTPLRSALSTAGRIYAGKASVGTVLTDPVEYACQQNFTLLTTDGFWNGDAGVKVDGAAMTNQDGGNTQRPKFEGSGASFTSNDSLADVAKYYRDTDLRTTALGNCNGAKPGVCQDPPPSTANDKQTMVTFTLGLGVDGRLAYTTDYKTATSGDFFQIKDSSKNWPKPTNDDPTAIDDLWHAAVNGDGTYFSAKDPVEVSRSLKDALASIKVKTGAATAAATSTLNPVTGDNNAYLASYTTGQWIGNLEKRAIDTMTGETGLAATACVENVVIAPSCIAPSSVVANGSGGYNCVTPGVTNPLACAGTLDGTDCKVALPIACNGTLKTKVAATTDTRTIKMNSGGALVDFSLGAVTSAGLAATFDNTFLAANLTQWPTLTAAQRANVTPANLANYLRGQKGFDENSADVDKRVFRKRQAVMGDAVDSKPAFIGKPTFSYTDPGYDTFKTNQAGRAKTVYMGANDGMLHAFDADTLQERWAYVPSMVIPNMWKLADTAYASKHSFYANGDPIISDICVSGCGGTSAVWKTILVAGLNGGGRGYYALDITNPASPTLLWEFDANDEPNLGYTFGPPVITKKPDGTWVVLVTSGYNNISDNSAFYSLTSTKFKPNNPPIYLTGNGQGYLYVLDALSGNKLTEIGTGAGSTTTPSGLTKIMAYADDAEKNNTTTYVYGGDLLGNLWRFNLSDNSKIKFAKLEAAGVAQPITTRPELGSINNKRVVFVGTGKYLEISDLTDTSLQTFYGIKDDNSSTTLENPRSTLVQQTIVPDGSDSRKSGTDNAVNFATGLGWYIDFPDSGERQNVRSQLVLGTLLVPTTVPTSSACQPAGYGWFNYLDYKTGKAVNLATDIVSTRTNAPTVGFNVVYIDGKPKVSIVTADDPTPKLIPGIPFSGSGTGFQKRRSIWRELIN